MFDLLGPFGLGLLTSLHCVGMCGPLILAYSLQLQRPGSESGQGCLAPWRRGFLHHLAFHAGRVTTYSLLGAVLGGFFQLAGAGQLLFALRPVVTLAAGALMTALGLMMLKVFPSTGLLNGASVGPGSVLGRIVPPLFRSPRVGARFALGLAVGFLPCAPLWAMMLKAAATQNVLGGGLTMCSYGLGTLPLLFLTGLSASMVSMRLRVTGEKMAGLSVVAMGLILVHKGLKKIGVLHCG